MSVLAEMASTLPLASVFDNFGGAIDFIFNQREPAGEVGRPVGGINEVLGFMWRQTWISLYALAVALAIALPIGLYLGHRGTGELLAVALGNAGRAIPELALIAFMAAFVGFGVTPLVVALMVLGIPPILTNAFVGMRQVDRGAVEAARGIGMTESQIIRRVEVPLAIPTIMTGVRTAAVNIVATATIAPLVSELTLGEYIINVAVYGDEGVLAGAIMVALLALAFELVLAGVQRLLTPRGLELQGDAARANA